MNTDNIGHTPARIIAGEARLNFLPFLFGRDFMRAENNVFLYADRYLQDYGGGMWEFARLPQGGGFMMPQGEHCWHFVNPDNWSDLEVSSEAAGVIITALELNHRSWLYDRHDQEELCRLFCRHHQQLMDWAETHPEAGAIFCALD